MSALTNNVFSETRCVGRKTCFTWKICEFYASPLENRSFLLSDFFEFESTSFCLKAEYAYTVARNVKVFGDCLLVCLVANSALPQEDYMYSVALINVFGDKVHKNRCFVQGTVKPTGLYIIAVVDMKESAELIVNDCLTIFCEVMHLETSHKDNFQPAQGAALSCTSLNALSRDLGLLFSSKENSDFVLRVEGQDIPVHSQILGARSPVLAAMFRGDFKENRARVLIITDMGISAMKCLLQYVYTGKARELQALSCDSLAELYDAAEKYDLKELKEMCSLAMKTRLSVKNMEKYAILAFTHTDQNLMTAVGAFFGSNKQLMNSDFMHQLTRKISALSEQILRFVAKGIQ